MRFSQFVAASVLAVVGLFGSFAPLLADGASLDGVEQDLVARINAFRAALGLPTLAVSDTLTGAAKWMSFDFGGVVDVGRAAPVARAVTTATVPQFQSHSVTSPQVALSPDSGYHASWSAQSPDPVVAAGERTTLVVALTNTGSRGWYRGVADQQANLGTSEPQDAERPDLAADWLSANRLTSTTTDYVGPGEVGWFEFTLRAPTTAGDYRLGLRGVVDGAAWLVDEGIFFE